MIIKKNLNRLFEIIFKIHLKIISISKSYILHMIRLDKKKVFLMEKKTNFKLNNVGFLSQLDSILAIDRIQLASAQTEDKNFQYWEQL